MPDRPIGPGWWRASDGRWYPPQDEPGALAPPPTSHSRDRPKPRESSIGRAWKWFRPRFGRLPLWAQIGLIGLVVALLVGIVVTAPDTNTNWSSSAGQVAKPPATETPFVPATEPAPTIRSYIDDPASLLAQRDGSSNVAAYAAALDALQPHCREDRVKLSGFADFGKSDLGKNGIYDETRLTVLQHILSSIPDAAGKTDCQGILATYLVLRESR